MSKTHWKKLTNPNYLGSYSLEDGKDIVLTIKAVRYETVTGADGKQEDCAVCYWVENQKPMILNTTNMKMIAKITGTPYIEDWAGQPIQIGVERVRAFGETVDALRVRKNKPRPVNAEPIVCEECGSVIEPVGNYTADQVAAINKKRYGKQLCAACSKKKAEANPAESKED